MHADNKLDCTSYVKTMFKASDVVNPGIFALDCEMVLPVVYNFKYVLMLNITLLNCHNALSETCRHTQLWGLN